MENTKERGQTVSVVIPVLNAERELPELLRRLRLQDAPPDEIIVVDSESDDGTKEICLHAPDVCYIGIRRADFDHGGTRDMALRRSNGDVVVFLTQDALPADRHLLSRLTAPLADEQTALANGRHLPKKDASRFEQLVRNFNYPAQSRIRTLDDLDTLGIKTFSNSDVCAAYRKDIYLKLGGFESPVRTNEDMFFAAKAIRAGYRTVYVADARVLHSHNFTFMQQFRRNYDAGYFLEQHKNLLCGASENGEGMRLVLYVTKSLLKEGRLIDLFRFFFDCAARLSGNKLGKLKCRRDG
ncbi:MAG: glycosyltransferase family 2 protein [Oscillospiraceae bacterium]|nr:glycosyltransferase family 2 protein [Oscillospiraceae bacterium]